jgi:arylsulfatase
VVILLDDLGFAQFGCYGSDIDTPNIDRLAANGLRCSNFHVTPVCSPTRAALLTGRSQHAVGMRSVSNFSSGFPHMRGHLSNNASTIAEVLRDEGYTTFGLGKWHLCQMENASAAGPYDQWPCQRGFDRFYGFLDGETDQFHPELIYDNHAIEPPATPEEGYHLSEDLVDRAIGFIHDTKSIRPDRPFFTYLPRPRFALRRPARQGLIPHGRCRGPQVSALAPSDATPASGVDDLSDNEQRPAARLQEAFAASTTPMTRSPVVDAPTRSANWTTRCSSVRQRGPQAAFRVAES